MEKMNYTVLLHKQLTGELAPGEQAVLDGWLTSNAAHPAMAEDIKKVWIWSQSKVSGWEPDVDGGLQKLRKRIDEDGKSKTVKRPMIFSLLKYAAAAIILFSLGYFVNGVAQVEQNWQVAQTGKNEIKTISLADGSEVTLNEGTHFDFPDAFNANNRVVKMDGEGFFKIARDEDRPFSIEMDQGTIRVLGTSFNIVNEAEANTITISVATGKVAFTPKGSSQVLILEAHDKIIYNADNQQYRQVIDVSPNDWSWKTKELVFQNTRLQEVIPAIEKHFGIRLSLDNAELADCRNLTATFTDVSKMDVLSALKLTVGVDIKKAKSPDTFVLFGGECE